jgi:hypothetical protein
MNPPPLSPKAREKPQTAHTMLVRAIEVMHCIRMEMTVCRWTRPP